MNRTSALILTIAIALCAPQVEAHGGRRDHHHKHSHHHRHHSHGWYPGAAFWWGAGYYPAPRAYAYAPYPVYPAYPPYAAGTVVVQPDPVVYVERQPVAAASASEAGSLWFYCTDPAGYYPYVQQCRQRWVSVDPASVSAPSRR